MEKLFKKKWYHTWDGKNIFMITILLIIPLATSVISTLHVMPFLGLANVSMMAIILAITLEAGMLTALAAMQITRFLKSAWSLYAIFILLTTAQLIGNIYYGYNFISEQLLINPNWIKNFVELFEFLHDPEDIKGWKRIISISVGAILPIISMIFLHINMEYTQAENPDLEKKEENLKPQEGNNVQEKREEKKEWVPDLVRGSFPEVGLALNSEEFPESYAEKSKLNSPEVSTKIINEDSFPSNLEEDKTEVEFEQVLTDEEIEEVKQHHEDHKETIQDIKEELNKNVEENLYTKLLTILYDGGRMQSEEKIPEYEDLLVKVKEHGINISDKELKQFLVLCTVIKIVDMNGRVFKKSFQQAKQIINFVA